MNLKLPRAKAGRQIDAAALRRAEVVSRQLEARTNVRLLSTSPIYLQGQDDRLESVGTGVFLRFGSRQFVASAGHVLKRLRDERLLIGADRLVPMAGRFFSSPSDDIDLGFFPLSYEQARQFDGAHFLSAEDIDLEAKPYLRHFYVIGFLAEDNSPADAVSQQVTSSAVGYLMAPAAKGKYSRLGLSSKQNWLFAFDRKELYGGDGSVAKEPVPEGLSGAGIWQFRAEQSDEKLVAMLIEHSEKHQVLVTTRLRPLVDSLSSYSG